MSRSTLVIVILGIAALAAGGFYFMSGKGLEAETTPIAVTAITTISDGWDVDELKAWSDPGLIRAMASQGQSAEQLMGIYSALGKLKQEPECVARATGMTMKNRERHDTVTHECKADYENGEAKISLTLIKAKSAAEWQIYYINIQSDVFASTSRVE